MQKEAQIHNFHDRRTLIEMDFGFQRKIKIANRVFV